AEIVERFREWAGVNIVVDEPALAEAGISAQHLMALKMSFKLDSVPLKKALAMVLHQVHLGCVIDPDVVLVTSEAQARGKLVHKIYSVDKLVPLSEPVILGVNSSEPIFAWATQTASGRVLRDDAPEDELIRLVQTIAPQTWSDNGGLGTIDYFPPSKSL